MKNIDKRTMLEKSAARATIKARNENLKADRKLYGYTEKHILGRRKADRKYSQNLASKSKGSTKARHEDAVAVQQRLINEIESHQKKRESAQKTTAKYGFYGDAPGKG